MSRNNLFNKYPAVIHGEARGENDEFVLHTRYPRFLALRSFDETFSEGLPAGAVGGEMKHTENGKLAFDSKIDIRLSDFIFLDSRPEDLAKFAEQLIEACNRCIADTIMPNEETRKFDD
ncbi:hypothetical protein D0T90_08940 [Neisseria animalis]|uniref:Uncharacterized protein n=2 Tax=Neisseria animalis TaxID=492 RepID=A0A5P3MU93_NEIAN|nr:hypothetical protein D0T90_08940 [Neisseria animalis]ROW33014.1 hypothetical protein CGZ60_01780 [Neisseria animalis]